MGVLERGVDEGNKQSTGFIFVSLNVHPYVCLGTDVIISISNRHRQQFSYVKLLLSSPYPARLLPSLPHTSSSDPSLSSVCSLTLSLGFQPYSYILILQTLSPPKLYQQALSLWTTERQMAKQYLSNISTLRLPLCSVSCHISCHVFLVFLFHFLFTLTTSSVKSLHSFILLSFFSLHVHVFLLHQCLISPNIIFFASTCVYPTILCPFLSFNHLFSL